LQTLSSAKQGDQVVPILAIFWQFFTLEFFCSYRYISFYRKSLALILTRYWLGYIWGDFLGSTGDFSTQHLVTLVPRAAFNSRATHFLFSFKSASSVIIFS
jgi:hypothetical protein